MRTDWQDYLVVLKSPDSPAGEAYRSLRAKLSRSLSAGKKRLMVMSAWAGDGKSMVCTNLGAVLAQLQLKVLLVDGDLRKPTLTRLFGLGNKPGFSNLLESGGSPAHLALPSGLENLFFLGRGTSRVNPSNLLAREGLDRTMSDMGDFGCILIDTPPLAACGDAQLISGCVDACVLVVNPKNWDGEAEVRFVEQIRETGTPVLGVVVNGADPQHQGYGYGYGYGYGNGYGDSGKKNN